MAIKILKPFKPLFEPKRYKVYYGGRGSGKSYAFAQALLIIGAQKNTRILCTREYQGSLRDSVHRLLCDTIERLGLQSFYNITQNTIVGLNGTTFIFEGLKNNVTKIKSMEGIDIVWCEEAENITEYSWEVLIPTIRNSGSEIWISFNPFSDMDSTYEQFVMPYIEELQTVGEYDGGDYYIRKINYNENPFFPDELRAEMEKCKKDNFNKYLHIWEGEPDADYQDSIIKPEWIEAAIDAHLKLKWNVRGIKGIGFDPADQGNDAKALCVRHGPVVIECDQWLEGDLEEGCERTFRVAQEHQVTDIAYDVIGIGAGASVSLKRLKGNSPIELQPFNGASSPDNPQMKYNGDRRNDDMFRNRRAQYYWYLRDRFEKTYRAVIKNEVVDPEELISLSSDMKFLKQLKGELSRIQRKHGRTESMSILIESKQDMKARGMKSPNLADALMYVFATQLKTNDKYSDWGKSIN